MEKIYIKIRESLVENCFDADFYIREDQALDPLDAGEVRLTSKNAPRIKYRIQDYKELGYEPSVSYESDFVRDKFLSLV